MYFLLLSKFASKKKPLTLMNVNGDTSIDARLLNETVNSIRDRMAPIVDAAKRRARNIPYCISNRDRPGNLPTPEYQSDR